MVFLAYGNSLQGGFVWDDRPLILEDYTVRSFQYLDQLFTNDFFSRDESNTAYGYYRPLTSLTYVVDYWIWKHHAFGYHLTNVLVHCLGSVLLVLVLIRLGFGEWVSMLAGLLFAVHPIHTENVAWISGRTDIWAFVLTVGSFLAYSFLLEGEPRGTRRWLLVSSVAVLFALALLAKEMAVVLLPWVYFYNLRQRDWKTAARRTSPLVAIFVLYAIWRFLVIGIAPPGQPEEHGWGVAAWSALPTVARYLAWLIVPFDQTAYVLNPYVTSPLEARFLLSLAGASVVAYILYRAFRVQRALCLFALALLSTFLPILNLVRIAGPPDMGAVMAERFEYFPSALFLALVAAGIGWLARRVSPGQGAKKAAVLLGVTALIAAPTAATIERNRVWKDDLHLYEDTLAKAPQAVLIWSNLTNLHIRQGNLAEAEKTMERVSQLGANSYYFYFSKTKLHLHRGELEEAIPLQEAIVANVSELNTKARNNLAFLYQRTGRIDPAIEILEELVRRGNGYSDVYSNLAQAYQQQGRHEDARRQYSLAMESQPAAVSTAISWASMEVVLGRHEEAEVIFRNLLEVLPEDAGLYNNLAVVQREAGREEQALQSFVRALELDPGHVKARLLYAKLLAKRGSGELAQEQFREVIRRAPDTTFAQEAQQYLP